MTDSLLERSQRIVGRWRDCIDEWSRHPSRPIPSTWHTAAVTALDDDLDMSRLVAMMHELDKAEVVEPGAKFEAFAYVNRVLAVDLMRNLGRWSITPNTPNRVRIWYSSLAEQSTMGKIIVCRYPTGR